MICFLPLGHYYAPAQIERSATRRNAPRRSATAVVSCPILLCPTETDRLYHTVQQWRTVAIAIWKRKVEHDRKSPDFLLSLHSDFPPSSLDSLHWVRSLNTTPHGYRIRQTHTLYQLRKGQQRTRKNIKGTDPFLKKTPPSFTSAEKDTAAV